MQINERYRKFPISFYQDGNQIYYESSFTKGTANTLNDALNKFIGNDFIEDLFYYYDDVIDVKVGTYIPSLKDKKKNGKILLGRLDIELDIRDIGTKQSITYLNKHKDELDAHLDWIEQQKKEKKFQEFKDKIWQGIKRFIDMLRGKNLVYEMFDPVKATTDHICRHCGLIIPTSCYYEEYRGEDYHIECLWDKIVNKMPENSYDEAKKFFMNLESFVGNWPAYGYDVEEDYLSDLELVKANKRNNLINETLDYYEKKYENLQEDFKCF